MLRREVPQRRRPRPDPDAPPLWAEVLITLVMLLVLVPNVALAICMIYELCGGVVIW